MGFYNSGIKKLFKGTSLKNDRNAVEIEKLKNNETVDDAAYTLSVAAIALNTAKVSYTDSSDVATNTIDIAAGEVETAAVKVIAETASTRATTANTKALALCAALDAFMTGAAEDLATAVAAYNESIGDSCE